MKHKTKKFTPELYWLLHHGILLEATSEPVRNRLRYIRRSKPEHERPIRLKWLRKVRHPDLLPKELVRAVLRLGRSSWDVQAKYDAYVKARDTASPRWRRLRQIYWDASNAQYGIRAEARELLTKHREVIQMLHKLECPGCPFDYTTGELIFLQP